MHLCMYINAIFFIPQYGRDASRRIIEMEGQREIEIPVDVYRRAQQIMRDYADICEDLHISDPAHLIGLMCFVKIVHSKCSG